MIDKDNLRLTQYSSGGGCGCKLDPDYLKKIINLGDSVIINSQFNIIKNKYFIGRGSDNKIGICLLLMIATF